MSPPAPEPSNTIVEAKREPIDWEALRSADNLSSVGNSLLSQLKTLIETDEQMIADLKQKVTLLEAEKRCLSLVIQQYKSGRQERIDRTEYIEEQRLKIEDLTRTVERLEGDLTIERNLRDEMNNTLRSLSAQLFDSLNVALAPRNLRVSEPVPTDNPNVGENGHLEQMEGVRTANNNRIIEFVAANSAIPLSYAPLSNHTSSSIPTPNTVVRVPSPQVSTSTTVQPIPMGCLLEAEENFGSPSVPPPPPSPSMPTLLAIVPPEVREPTASSSQTAPIRSSATPEQHSKQLELETPLEFIDDLISESLARKIASKIRLAPKSNARETAKATSSSASSSSSSTSVWTTTSSLSSPSIPEPANVQSPSRGEKRLINATTPVDNTSDGDDNVKEKKRRRGPNLEGRTSHTRCNDCKKLPRQKLCYHYQCPLCEKAFDVKEDLKDHTAEEHNRALVDPEESGVRGKVLYCKPFLRSDDKDKNNRELK